MHQKLMTTDIKTDPNVAGSDLIECVSYIDNVVVVPQEYIDIREEAKKSNEAIRQNREMKRIATEKAETGGGFIIVKNNRYILDDGRIGICKFKGRTDFGKSSETWIGIVVEYGKGKQNGRIDGKTYFRCDAGKGIMVKPKRILIDEGSKNRSKIDEKMKNKSKTLSEIKPEKWQIDDKYAGWNPPNSDDFKEQKLKKKIQRKKPKINTNSLNNTAKRKQAKELKNLSGGGFKIVVNHRYILDDGRIGICKFKGRTVFGKSSEDWIGIVVEYGNGKHNGTIDGKKYFPCGAGKGIMVKPKRILIDEGNKDRSKIDDEIKNKSKTLSETKPKKWQIDDKYAGWNPPNSDDFKEQKVRKKK
eukprot:412235_1